MLPSGVQLVGQCLPGNLSECLHPVIQNFNRNTGCEVYPSPNSFEALYFLEPGAFLIRLVTALTQNILVPYSFAYDLMLNVLFQ